MVVDIRPHVSGAQLVLNPEHFFNTCPPTFTYQCLFSVQQHGRNILMMQPVVFCMLRKKIVNYNYFGAKKHFPK